MNICQVLKDQFSFLYRHCFTGLLLWLCSRVEGAALLVDQRPARKIVAVSTEKRSRRRLPFTSRRQKRQGDAQLFQSRSHVGFFVYTTKHKPSFVQVTRRLLSSSSFVVVFRRRLSSSSSFVVVVFRRRHRLSSSSSFVVVFRRRRLSSSSSFVVVVVHSHSSSLLDSTPRLAHVRSSFCRRQF